MPPALPPPFIKIEPSSSGATAFNHSVLAPRLTANIKKEPSFSTSASAPVFRKEPYPTINHNAAIATVHKAQIAKAVPSSSSVAIDPVPMREPYPNVNHDTATITPQASFVNKEPSSSSPSATNASVFITSRSTIRGRCYQGASTSDCQAGACVYRHQCFGQAVSGPPSGR